MRICVIGGGAAGLCALRNFAANLNNFELVAFEKTEKVGGTWVYNEKTGLDSNGLPIHSSMYRDLRTNLPCEIMNFPDYRKMKGDKFSTATHQQILSYLQNYAQHFQLYQYIQFNTLVEHVKPEFKDDDSKTVWKVQIKNLKTNQIFHEEFDGIIVCTGQYYQPNVPKIPGIETFPGTILHSHSYRRPEDFTSKLIVVLGASSSGIDIGIELCAHADHVYLSHHGERLVSILPPQLTQVMEISRIEKNKIHFADGNSVQVDAIIYCTGYLITFPFLDPSCGITVDNNYVYPIYKHMININYPTMCILGINNKVVPFPMFHMKAQYFLAYFKGELILPAKNEMMEDSKLKTEKKRHAHALAEQQWSFNNSLAKAGGFNPLPPFYETGYKAWWSLRKSNLWHYKDYKLIIADDNKSVDISLE
ncbi:flavin-containing monooxygenase FMO GS-OX-like 2 [Leptopilina heterotoma]|uniref:flavin-containing monooxygenase FMO GS-OX-like 2 n=1 Tax=Leptopilina heterotoma TaxID=63436 RepID=UPI001CA7EF52|nr:flavin-containing monooxygenase FMO GS-OX-like 2 [Leptopilina heterotoma]XP_043468286.1 flavin-containing monooxygenase FMO GS-OX-like 2 [Leptopilina heterotoma]XP_043468287.1 flavin-containing monooxygenase FMO GS-OX-like 2 [Leptopilina heterotoma]XP_043468288.1 flavin-containing monooxygenase FMO GS-OX-like 2 [Leptopilina heterotoma]XP_043468289.1 flavin-containing monooxygenase FMO GS-OX-like 2 [Leptopilina heterotoma]XP_043468290.1 flavin-containing monooxygenase FMO GS-OX-like 2 [Lepto